MSAYKVLYRKYRPRTFSDVVDQTAVTETLKNELTRGRVAHAYLFTGSRGTGKTTCAKILAKAVNCLDPRNGDPCGECAVCRGIDDGSILDVMEIDAASNNGVDNIRQLIEEAQFTPATAKYRVYIIDEAHMITEAAFNALLKTLEEPPAHVIFILATTEVHKLLPTILSRCQRFDFHRISPQAIADRLEEVAGQEGAQLDPEAGLLIARLADGALRDALSLLDQCLGRSAHVTVEVVDQTAGLAGREYLTTLTQAVTRRDIPEALATVDRLYRDSKDMTLLCRELTEYYRGLMLIKAMKDASALVAASPAQWEEMTRQALSMELSEILHGLDTFEETLNKMRLGGQRTQLEMAFVRLCSPQLDQSPAALLRRVEDLERGTPRLSPPQAAPAPAPLPAEEPRLAFPEPPAREKAEPVPQEREAPAQPAGAPPPEEPAAPAPEPPRPAPKAAVDVAQLSAQAEKFRGWSDVLQIIRGATKSVAMAFAGSNAYINGDYMLIEAPDIAFELLKRSEQRQRIHEAIRQITGRTYRLGPYVRAGAAEQTDPLEDLTRRAAEAGIPTEEVSAQAESPEE